MPGWIWGGGRHADTRYRYEPYRGGAETQTADKRAGKRNQASERREQVSGRGECFFRCEPSEVNKKLRMKFIDIKTNGSTIKGKIAFYCDALHVTKQGFYWYLRRQDLPWKYEGIAEKMQKIVAEDECNDTYGCYRMYQALKLKSPDDEIPSERTVYKIMEETRLSHRTKRKPNGLTKADRNARKSEELFKRDFSAERSPEKCVTDITEIPARDGKLYVSAIFDSYDLGVLGLAMADNMKADLCVSAINNAYRAYPSIRGAVIHSDGGRCHDNARCVKQCGQE